MVNAYDWSSAKPTLLVVLLTAVQVHRSVVVETGVNVRVRGLPSLGSEATCIMAPVLNLRVDAVH